MSREPSTNEASVAAVAVNEAHPSDPPTSARVSGPNPISISFHPGDDLVGRYRLERILGEGATGVVYEATRLEDGVAVAVKVIHRHLAGDAQIRGRFVREGSILRRLRGAHLCSAIDFGTVADPVSKASELLFMVMPLIRGTALDSLLRQKELPLSDVITIMLDVCDALADAHSQGVIHRDLKPGNVLIQSDGHALVVDFGMAKIIAGASTTAATILTQHNMVFGTPEYMAPEQARGDELDSRCDIYAAGIMLYELVCGTVPFGGTSALAILTSHMTVEPTPPRVRSPERKISPAFEATILHAIAKDPSARYATASNFANAIRQALGAPDNADAVRPEGIGEPFAPTLPAIRASAVPPPRSTLPTVPSPITNEPNSPLWIAIWIVAAVVGIALGIWFSLQSG